MARSAETVRKQKTRKAARIHSRKVQRILNVVSDRTENHHAMIRAIRRRLGCDLSEARVLYRDAKQRLHQMRETANEELRTHPGPIG